MSTVMRGRAAQVDKSLELIEQAASACESAAIAVEEVVDVDDPGVSREAISERLDTALMTIEDALGTLQEQRERLS